MIVRKKLALGFFLILMIGLIFIDSKPSSADCRDVGCNASKRNGLCRRGLAPQEFCGSKGPVPCCCSPKKHDSSKPCNVIGCSKVCDVCSQGKRRISYYTADTEPFTFPFGGFRSLGVSCCCPNGEANIKALTCQDIQFGCEASSSVVPRCSSDQRFASFDIYVKDETIPETSPPTSSSSGCPIPFPPGSDCDIGTLQRTVTCCCR